MKHTFISSCCLNWKQAFKMMIISWQVTCFMALKLLSESMTCLPSAVSSLSNNLSISRLSSWSSLDVLSVDVCQTWQDKNENDDKESNREATRPEIWSKIKRLERRETRPPETRRQFVVVITQVYHRGSSHRFITDHDAFRSIVVVMVVSLQTWLKQPRRQQRQCVHDSIWERKEECHEVSFQETRSFVMINSSAWKQRTEWHPSLHRFFAI